MRQMQLPNKGYMQHKNCSIRENIRYGVHNEESDCIHPAISTGEWGGISIPKFAHWHALKNRHQNLSPKYSWKERDRIGEVVTYHCSEPAVNNGCNDKNGNANLAALFKHSPVKRQYREFCTTDSTVVAKPCDEDALCSRNISLFIGRPDLSSQAMVNH